MTSTRSVVIVPSWALEPRGRPARWCANRRAVLARQPQDAAPAGADTGKAPPRPQLAVALAVEGAGSQELPDFPDQGLVQHRAERPGSLVGGSVQSVPMAVDGRARHAPQARDPLDPVHLSRGGRDSAAHRLDLRRAKGRSTSRRSVFASRSSAVIVSSPTLACSRSISASRASAGRLFSDASPRPGTGRASRSARPRSQPGRARPAPGPRPAGAAAPFPACVAPTSAAVARAWARLRQRGGRAPPGPRPPLQPRPSSPPCNAYLQSGVSKNRRPGDYLLITCCDDTWNGSVAVGVYRVTGQGWHGYWRRC